MNNNSLANKLINNSSLVKLVLLNKYLKTKNKLINLLLLANNKMKYNSLKNKLMININKAKLAKHLNIF